MQENIVILILKDCWWIMKKNILTISCVLALSLQDMDQEMKLINSLEEMRNHFETMNEIQGLIIKKGNISDPIE